MKVLKIIGIAFLAIIVIYLVLCLIGPKDFEVSRSTTINAEPSAVFEQVAELQNWGNWSPWHEMDTAMEITYGESTRGKGASYSWKGEKAGEGSLETIEFEENRSIKNKLDFGAMGTSFTTWTFTEVEAGTEVTWAMTGENNFLFRGMVLFMDFEQYIAEDFDKGLSKLKEFVESNATASDETEAWSYTDPKLVEREALTCLCVSGTSTDEELPNFFTQAYTQIGIYMGSNQLEMAGQPLAIYQEPWDPTNIVLKACIPFEGQATGSGEIEVFEMPAGQYVLTSFYGDYNNMEGAHAGIQAFLAANELNDLGWSFEQYITDPMTESNPANWQTDIAYPIAQ